MALRAGLAPGVVDIGLFSPARGVGMRLGVVRPDVLTGSRLREEAGRLLVGSVLYMLGEEEDMALRSPLGPLGGREEPGLSFLEEGVFLAARGEGCMGG